MVTLPLTRDEARMIQKNFLPYMLLLIKAKAAGAETGSNKHLRYKIVFSLICDVKVMFTKKLATGAKKLKFKLSDAHGIALYVLLMRQPIAVEAVYAHLLRQKLCDRLYQQLIDPLVEEQELD